MREYRQTEMMWNVWPPSRITQIGPKCKNICLKLEKVWDGWWKDGGISCNNKRRNRLKSYTYKGVEELHFANYKNSELIEIKVVWEYMMYRNDRRKMRCTSLRKETCKNSQTGVKTGVWLGGDWKDEREDPRLTREENARLNSLHIRNTNRPNHMKNYVVWS